MGEVVITGAGGFVASTLLPFLVERGFEELTLIDPKPLDEHVLDGLRRLGVRIRSIQDNSLSHLDTGNIDRVICLAGATSVDAALTNPGPAVAGNLAIAQELGEWARVYAPSIRIVYMSSDEVLGESFVPLPSDAPLRPTQPYAASKAAAEILLHNYRDVYDLNIATVRSCNLIGRGQKPPKLIPTAVNAMAKGVPVPIHGSGEQLREWLAVEDLCEALLLASEPDNPPIIYQAASGWHRSVNNVVSILATILGVPLETIHVTDRLVQDRCYAMQVMELQKLGWQPKISLPEAISDSATAIWDAVSQTECRYTLV